MSDPLTQVQEAALSMLERLAAREDSYSAANDVLRCLQKDFPTHVHALDGELYQPLLALIDAALGDDVGSYFFHECRSMKGRKGEITEKDGTRWPIGSVDDIRAYLNGTPGGR